MKLLGVVVAILGSGLPLAAQSSQVSALDALTPKGLEPGSPAGSYALSGLDTINLYNGNLNFSVPLLHVGGRGESGYTLRAQPASGWEAIGDKVASTGFCTVEAPCPTWTFTKSGTFLAYRPAKIEAKYVGQPGSVFGGGVNTCTGTYPYAASLGRITISLADGTEIEFRDAIAGGAMRSPSPPDCSHTSQGGFNRGKIWVSADGSGAKFVADTDIHDPAADGSGANYQPGGTLYLREGTKYHFNNYPVIFFGNPLSANDVDWIEDRNGNRTVFLYPTPQNSSIPNPNGGAPCAPILQPNVFQGSFCIIDPIGRMVTVTIGKTWTGSSDPGCVGPPCAFPQGYNDEIQFPGANGVSRFIEVYRREYWFDRISTLNGTTWPTYQNLFGGYACGVSSCPSQVIYVAAQQLSKILLPDNSFYQFKYDQYGDVAQVTLPTGGAFEFDWQNYQLPNGTTTLQTCPAEGPYPTTCFPIVHDGNNNPDDLLIAVYRRVVQRREYPDGAGTTWTRKTGYAAQELNHPNVSVTHDPIGTCTAAPTYPNAPGYLYATEGWCTQVQVDEADPQGTLATQVHYFYGAASQGMFPVPGWYSMWLEGKEFHTDSLRPGTTTALHTQIQSWVEGPGLATALNWWTPTGSQGGGSSGPKPSVDPRIYQSDLTIENGKITRQLFATDGYGNRTDLTEYDYATTAPGALLRHTHTDFQTAGYDTVPTTLTGTTAPSKYLYLVTLPSLEAIDGGGSAIAQTKYFFDEVTEGQLDAVLGIVNSVAVGTFRGNLTTLQNWRNTDGVWLSTSTSHDVAGNPTRVIKPGSRVTRYTYNACAGGFPSTVSNPLLQVTTFTWDCGVGMPTSITTPPTGNTPGSTTTAAYGDSLDRPTTVIRASNNTNAHNQTQYGYSANPTTVQPIPLPTRISITTTNDKDSFQGGGLISDAVTDGLGRVIQTMLHAPEGMLVTQKDLDGLGRTRKAYNPTIGAPATSADGTTYAYDGLGRVARVDYADSSFETTDYSGGDTITHTDPAGKMQRQTVDALGRILKIVEDPNTLNYTTSYCYDPLDDLVLVNQGGTASCASLSASGGQTRSFAYNSLKELTSANNPEVGGAVTYAYFDSGNVQTKTAPGVTTTYAYDLLDRVTSKTYNDGTPPVTYGYDILQTGCLDSVTSTAATVTHTTSFSDYDPYCRVTASTQTVSPQIGASRSYNFHYQYNLSGAPISETYPSGRVIATSYDGAGRPTSVGGSQGGTSTTYVSGVTYWPHGAIDTMTLRATNQLVEQSCYTNRLQVQAIRVGGSKTSNCTNVGNTDLINLGYSYATGQNNGNVVSQTITYQSITEPLQTLTQNYSSYDGVNRLTAFIESGKTQGYGHDPYGNHWVSPSDPVYPASNLTPKQQSDFLAANNRLNIVADCAINPVTSGYDQRGNLKYLCPVTLAYDGEDRQKSAVSPSASASYEYDGEGRRVRKLTCSDASACTASSSSLVTTVYVYDAFGRLAAEYSTQSNLGGTEYYTADHLGSTRLVTDGSGGVKRRYDYLPFGEGLGAGVNGRSAKYSVGASSATADGQSVKFSGKERDAETGLDFFGARYMSAAQGRFTSPDAAFADQALDNPQSWNLYAYVRNNPLALIDSTGRGAANAAVRAARAALELELFDAARRVAVRKAWAQEREILQTLGADAMYIRLTKAEQRELLERGAVTGWEGHHINSVAHHDLAMAGDPNNIKFVKGRSAHLDEHGRNFRNKTTGPLMDRLSKLGGAALLTFFAVYDQKMNEYSSESPIISSPDSWWSTVNPVNWMVENAAIIEAFAAAEHAQEEEDRKRREEEQRRKREEQPQ